MRKFLSALILLMFLVGIASADTLRVGILSKLNMSQEEYSEFIAAGRKAGAWSFFSSTAHDGEITFVFYDTLQAMQLALNTKDVDEIALPEDVAEYVLNVTGKYKVSGIAKTLPAYLSFGFRSGDDPELREKFNGVLLEMKEDGTLAILQSKYIAEAGIGDPEAIEFRNFGNIDKKITVAITGDLPPIDYVAADGTPAGFNTAVLAEIAKRLKINVEVINIDSAARASALASGRCDTVFWIQGHRDVPKHSDIPEGITLSEPYYEWNEYLYLAPSSR